MSQLVVVNSYSYSYQAQIARASLENAGIPAVVSDEHAITANWLYSQALGGVKVLVPESRLDEAAALLSQDFSQEVEDLFGKEAPVYCPSCGSENHAYFTKGKVPAYIVFMLLGFPLFFYQRGSKCQDCGHFWRD